MDPFLIGLCQHYIDAQLEEEELQNIKGIIDFFGMGFKSKLDATIGFFLGYSYAQLLTQFFILNSRLPNKDEILQYYKLMKRRVPEIIRETKKIKVSKIKDFGEDIPTPMDIELEPDQQALE